MSIKFVKTATAEPKTGDDSDYTFFGKELLAWWQGLEDDRGSRAVLRRAADLNAVEIAPPFLRLYQRFAAMKWEEFTPAPDHHRRRLAAVVGILVHVKHHQAGTRAPTAMSKAEGDKPAVSELRFTRLLDSPDLDSFFIGMRRVLPLIDEGVDVLQLAQDIFYWGDDTAKKWAYTYVWPAKKTP